MATMRNTENLRPDDSLRAASTIWRVIVRQPHSAASNRRLIEPRSTMCPSGCGPMTMIGEDVSKRLDVNPAQFRPS
jgi:transposase